MELFAQQEEFTQAKHTLLSLKQLNPDCATQFQNLVISFEQIFACNPDNILSQYLAKHLAAASKCNQEAIERLGQLEQKVKRLCAQPELINNLLCADAKDFASRLCFLIVQDIHCYKGGSLFWHLQKNWHKLGLSSLAILGATLLVVYRKKLKKTAKPAVTDAAPKLEGKTQPKEGNKDQPPPPMPSIRWISYPEFSAQERAAIGLMAKSLKFGGQPVRAEVIGIGCGRSQLDARCASHAQYIGHTLNQLSKKKLAKYFKTPAALKTLLSGATEAVKKFALELKPIVHEQEAMLRARAKPAAIVDKKLHPALKTPFVEMHDGTFTRLESTLLVGAALCKPPAWLQPDNGVIRLAQHVDACANGLVNHADDNHITSRQAFSDPKADCSPDLAELVGELSVIDAARLQEFQAGTAGITLVFQPSGSQGHFVCARLDFWPDAEGGQKVTITYVDSMRAGSANPTYQLRQHDSDALLAIAQKLLNPGPMPVPKELQPLLPAYMPGFRDSQAGKRKWDKSYPKSTISESSRKAVDGEPDKFTVDRVWDGQDPSASLIPAEDRIPALTRTDIPGLLSEEANLQGIFAHVTPDQFKEVIIDNEQILPAAKELFLAKIKPLCQVGQPLARFGSLLPAS